ncbi:phenylalanine--tRNA ligase subunit alpha [Candidatus Micrarchaeota archaeon]|nr:phenylalanine--tRNA ligase subunit alpha [Candidatus Micrarchaeota archaeon]
MYKGEWEIYQFVSKNKTATIDAIAQALNLSPDTVRRAIESLKAGGYVTTSQSSGSRWNATSKLAGYLKDDTLPPYLIFIKAENGMSISDLTPEEQPYFKWAKDRKFVSVGSGGKLLPAKPSDVVQGELSSLLRVARLVASEPKAYSPVDSDLAICNELRKYELIELENKAFTSVSFTGKTMEEPADEFDISAPAADAPVAKAHPISALSEKIRKIMSELGFEEMEGDIVESSFWNFDALFQPQDHPARELADTFYLNGSMPLPNDRKLVERIKNAHEEGWKYQWSEKEATKMVLRTHTTALSARYLSEAKDKKPRKYFAVGRVFRNEATDYKHLAEFHQVEGIIAWEGATFTDLLGILKEFYRKLGFEKIRFRPSFFPYTEPSLEIEVYFEPRKQWLELGGAGIFRPEVSIPLAGVYPVLAWGLSLERPLMLSLGLEDIRSFYKNDVEFLKKSRLDL